MNYPILSIIICTYNRCEILSFCLDSLLVQATTLSSIEIIVIDNNSTDETQRVVEKYRRTHPQLSYYLESKQGLSHARNRGYQEAKGDWVGYLDDDAMVEENFLKATLQTITEGQLDIFGGKITPWFKYGQPRWLKNDFEVNIPPHMKKGPTSPYLIFGGAMFFNKKILLASSGFSPKLGMNGTKMAYGEETHFINELHDLGFAVGIDPKIVIRHIVAKRKLKLWWHIKNRYAKGRDAMYVKNPPGIFNFCYCLTIKLLYQIASGFHRIIIEKDFYWENYFLLIMKHIAFTFGQITHYFSSRMLVIKNTG